MKWMGQRQSANVEDRRGGGGGKLVLGGAGSIVVVLVCLFLGVDPRAVMSPGGGSQQTQGEYRESADEAQLRQFTSVVLADTEDVWREQFRRQLGKEYRDPKLVMYTGSVDSACGMGQSAMGPFYCPGDEKVYIDLSFYQQLRDELGSPGDFAQAYVIAHEIGHHIQNQLGVFARYGHGDKGAEGNQVRIELQADFYAGCWAHYAMKDGQLEKGDIEEAMNAAAQIGDDRLQKRSQGYVVPDSFTHGSSAQRARWFRKGLETGDMRQGDTFNTNSL